jgi:Holliday junction resolvase
MGRYSVGYRLERRVQSLYADHGWLVTRFPTSGRQLYPADVFAVKRISNNTHIHLIECKNMSVRNMKKNTLYVELRQIQKLQQAAQRHHALPLLAYSFPYQHARILPIEKLQSSGKMMCLQRDDGILLSRFLSTIE